MPTSASSCRRCRPRASPKSSTNSRSTWRISNREARGEGLEHAQALERATAALTASAQAATELRSSSRTPADRLLDRVHAALTEPIPSSRRRLAWLTDLRRDVRLAIRSLVQAPGFTTVAVITLALGIGGTATIFSAIDAVLLRDAPVASPRSPGQRVSAKIVAFDSESHAGRDSGAVGGLAAFAGISLSLNGPDGAERIDAQIVSGNYFDVVGVRAALGRALLPSDDTQGAPVRVLVLSYGLWQRWFGAEVTLVGRSIAVNGNPYTVVGIAPPGFAGPVIGELPDAWVPMALQEEVRPPSSGALRRRLGSRGLAQRQRRTLAEHGGPPS